MTANVSGVFEARGCAGRRRPRRVHVVGNSCSGKSTLARCLSQILQADFVELDALNWLPGWVALAGQDPAELRRRFVEATTGDAWVAAGSYMEQSQSAFWPRLDTVVWLDLPIAVLLRRLLRRSWQRSRERELLWGTNYESFWAQFAVWRKDDSLLWWIATQQKPKQREMRRIMADPRWGHIRFFRLSSEEDVEQFLDQMRADTNQNGCGRDEGDNREPGGDVPARS